MGIIMSSTNPRTAARIRRQARIRKKIKGTTEMPRLSVFRSAKHVYAQVIDDSTGATLATASSVEKDFQDQGEIDNKKSAAVLVGKLVAQRALDKGINKVVFDRNGFLYHGRVKAISEGAREAGLKL
jgi:large subunit ribosomal protein L18